MSIIPGEGSSEMRTVGIDGVEDPFDTTLGEMRGTETESPKWLQDIDCFQAAHRQAVEKVHGAFADPSEENLDSADEAIIIARKNSDLLFEKGFFWDHTVADPGDTANDTISLPLRSAVGAIARAIEDLDKQLKELFPLKIARDEYSVDDLEGIVKDVQVAVDEKDAHEPIGKLCQKYAVLCTEMQDALKAPRITRASKTLNKRGIAGQTSSEWKKQAIDLGLAGVVLLGATVLGNILSRPKK